MVCRAYALEILFNTGYVLNQVLAINTAGVLDFSKPPLVERDIVIDKLHPLGIPAWCVIQNTQRR